MIFDRTAGRKKILIGINYKAKDHVNKLLTQKIYFIAKKGN